MDYDFDVIVIGSGPGGSSVATRCAKEGLKVAVFDELFGGTCALKGCTPKKAMEAVSTLWWETQQLQQCGFPTLSEHLDWKKLMAHKEKFTALVPAFTKKKFRDHGIEVIEAKASFHDEHTLLAGKDKYTAQHIVIATGAKPTPLSFSGADHLLTSADFFELDELPDKMIFVGGGYIAFELAHIATAAGCQVSIISDVEQPLGAFDPKLTKDLILSSLEKGIDIRLGFEVEDIQETSEGYQVTIQRKSSAYKLNAGLVFHAAGRIPNVADLQLHKAKIDLNDEKGIEVNEFLQVPNHQDIYALGDVTGRFPFTEIANYEGDIVAQNILQQGDKQKVSIESFPVTLFTHPKVAAVGQLEKELQEQDIKYQITEDTLEKSLSERSLNNAFARYRVFSDPKTGKILGAHLLGTKADEVINLFATAMQMDISADQIKALLLTYPTATNSFKHMV